MNLITKLRSTTSRVDKECMLRHMSELELEVFRHAYTKDYTYGLTFSSYEIDMNNLGEPSYELIGLLTELRTRRVSGNAARELVAGFAIKNGDLIKLICNKDLDCGVTATTINKAKPGAVPQFVIQLAKEVPVASLKCPCLAQIKYDGVRLITKIENSEPRFFTRNGKEVQLSELANILRHASINANIVLDGEITIECGLSDDRTSVSGMINSAMHGGTIDESRLVYHVFDYLPLTDFESSYCPLPYNTRTKLLLLVVGSINNRYIVPAKSWYLDSTNAISELYEKITSLGYEGLIIKKIDHKYTFKRSADWAKLKEVKTADIRCIDIEEGDGKYEGLIGALVCEGIVEGKLVQVKVGSGLTDADRDAAWDEYIGKTIEIKYNAVIQSKTNSLPSLFLPRFVQVRFDK